MFNTWIFTLLTSGSVRRQLVAGLMAPLLACCLIAPPAGAVQYQNPATGQAVEVDIKGVKVMIQDLDLRDQDGRRVRFYSDLIKGKVVVLSFFYTSCAYICTMQGKLFSELQSLLGERLGKSVFLISVTTDPVKDNPERLKAWVARYSAKPGWTLVTGEEAEMNKLLIQFTGNTAGGGMHLAATFIGNDRTGFWISGVGVFAPEELLRAIDYVARESAGGG